MRLDRIKLIVEMARADIPATELAKLATISRSTVTAVKCGKSCSMTTANKIAQALGISVDDLLKKGEV